MPSLLDANIGYFEIKLKPLLLKFLIVFWFYSILILDLSVMRTSMWLSSIENTRMMHIGPCLEQLNLIVATQVH